MQHTSLHTGHLASRDADLGPSQIRTDAAVQTQLLQKRCPQPKAYALNTISCEKESN